MTGTLTMLGKTRPRHAGNADNFGCTQHPRLKVAGLRRRLQHHDPAQPMGHGAMTASRSFLMTIRLVIQVEAIKQP